MSFCIARPHKPIMPFDIILCLQQYMRCVQCLKRGVSHWAILLINETQRLCSSGWYLWQKIRHFSLSEMSLLLSELLSESVTGISCTHDLFIVHSFIFLVHLSSGFSYSGLLDEEFCNLSMIHDLFFCKTHLYIPHLWICDLFQFFSTSFFCIYQLPLDLLLEEGYYTGMGISCSIRSFI